MMHFKFLRGAFRISAFLEFLQETSLTSYLLPEPRYSGGAGATPPLVLGPSEEPRMLANSPGKACD